MAARYAISLMALLGSAAAQGYSNMSSSAVSTTSSGASAQYTDGATPQVGGVKFYIQTDTTYQGTLLTLSRKRQSNADIGSCLSTCAASTACEGTAFVQDTMSCLYYSTVDASSASSAPGTDFALVESRATASGTSSVFNGTTPVTRGPTSRTAVPSTFRGNSTTRAPVGGSSTRSNGASTRTPTTSSSAPTSTPSGLITLNGVEFLIEINITYSGITIDFEILTKRAGYTLNQCLTTCANNVECAGTAFDSTTGDCTFYSSITSGSRQPDVGTTFGTVVYRQNAANGTAPASNVTAESLICPAYNGHVITSSVNTAFSVSCSQFLIGTTFDIKPELMRRQAMNTGLPQTLSNCVDLCALAESCVGTTFEAVTQTCSYYSDVAYAVALDGFDSATRVQDNNNNNEGSGETTTTVFVAAPTTATVYTTSVSTVYVYAGDAATAYPSGAVITTVVPVGTTTYTNWVPTANIAIPTVTVTQGAGAAAYPTVTVTVGANGNAGAGGAGGAAGAAYPTVTVHDTVTYCPQQTTWTTVYV